MKIIIADDHPVVRRGLKGILEEALGGAAVDEADDGHGLLTAVRKEAYDVVLLDISMPGISGLDVLKQLKAEQPNTPVLILSMHPEDHYAIRMLKAGASGYLTKASAPDELVGAVRKVRAGRRYVGPALAEKLADEIGSGAAGSPHETLSDREYQVLCLLASGKAVKDVAETLSLSVKTISTYRTRILEKMGMGNNAELTRYAIENGLV